MTIPKNKQHGRRCQWCHTVLHKEGGKYFHAGWPAVNLNANARHVRGQEPPPDWAWPAIEHTKEQCEQRRNHRP